MEYLEIQDISKSFPGVKALDRVSFSIKKGVIHGLVGKNGAGKSTLVKIIAGHFDASGGKIFLNEKEITNLGIHDIQQAGIRICPQHVNVVNQLTVKENLALGDWPKTRFGLIDWKKLTKDVKTRAERYGLDIDVEKQTSELSLHEKRQVNIIHVLLAGAEVVILDEPTTSLTPRERRRLFDFMSELRDREGITFIYISHYSEEILDYCDSYTVLRNGRHVQSGEVKDLDENKLSSLISGKEVKVFLREKSFSEHDLLRVKALTGKNFQDINLTLHQGEILGIAGLHGSGAREFIRTLYGLGKIEKGSVFVEANEVDVSYPWHALKCGISYLSHDRHGEGLVGLLSIKDNIALSNFDKVKNKWRMLDERELTANTKKIVSDYNIVTAGIDTAVMTLSGGNQQKVCLGMVFNTSPKIVMLDEPTRGIDVEVKEDVHRIINRLSREDKIGFMYFSTDFEEMCRVVDRVIIFSNHRVKEELTGDDITITNIISRF